jgi:hypothetical protein
MAANLLCRIRWAARQAGDCESDGGIRTVASFQFLPPGFGFLSEIELLLAPLSLNPYHHDLTHGILRSGAW